MQDFYAKKDYKSMCQRYSRLIENSCEFIFFSKEFMLGHEEDREIISQLELKEVNLDQINIANDYKLKLIEDKEIKYVCLKTNQQVAERLNERLYESIKPHAETLVRSFNLGGTIQNLSTSLLQNVESAGVIPENSSKPRN